MKNFEKKVQSARDALYQRVQDYKNNSDPKEQVFILRLIGFCHGVEIIDQQEAADLVRQMTE